MAYELEDKILKLRFEDYEGLEVTARAPSLGELLELQDLAGNRGTAAGIRELFKAFAGYLDGWNLTRGGKPVPATFEGLLGLDPEFVEKISTGFMRAVTGAEVPTIPGSGATPSREMEASIPMTASSGPGT